METLKIKLLNFYLIKIGLKTLEVRDKKRIGEGGEFLLTTPKGKVLGVIKLEFSFSYYDRLGTASRNWRPYLYQSFFYKKWLAYYIAKNGNPSFYEIIRFCTCKDCIKEAMNG